MKNLQKFLPHLMAVLGFVLVAVFYFYPILKGQKIYQSDIVQFTGMAKEQNDFRAEEKQEPFWTNSAFGGMPTYQLGAKYPHDFVGGLDDVLRFLPRPADYLFLYFLGFYILLMVLKIDPLKAFFGALAFGFSTYLIIILGVGHNAKAHAIAYMPMVLAGVLLVFRKKYVVGGLLTMIAAALEINANHFQMTYYLLLLLLIVSIYYLVNFIKEKDFKGFAKVLGVFVIAGVLAVGTNATALLATSEYAKFSTRGESELTFEPDGSKKVSTNAMSYDYITEYSYGIAESLNLIAPRLFGGSNGEDLGQDSEMYQFILNKGASPEQAAEAVSEMPAYWGEQPIVAAPAYVGIIVFFLAILSLFVEKRKIKYVLITGVLVSLMLSWGKNFSLLTDFFINYVPLYNKFRAVSSIQVILELCLPVLAVLGLYGYFKADDSKKWNSLWKSSALVGGILVSLFLFKGSFDFTGGSDGYFSEAYGADFVRVLKEDRASLFVNDILRALGYLSVVFGVMYLGIKNILSHKTTLILVGLVMVLDLFFTDKNYVNKDNFKSKREVDMPFQMTEADRNILEDTTHFRVFEAAGNMSSARSSYFHKSLGGYSAVKPRRMQQMFDYQIAKNNLQVYNMLNTKYIIQTNDQGEDVALLNPDANGNAWFIKKLKVVKTADEEMKALDSLRSKDEAVVQSNINSYVGSLSQNEFNSFIKNQNYQRDSIAKIDLVEYKPNHLKYKSNNSNKGLAVFSEMYYEKGWNATIDGKETPIYRVNYALRGLEVPAGNHSIEFKFEPQVVKTGSTIVLFSSIGMLLLLIGGIYLETKEERGKKKE
ncbi:YfhO family protein [Flavobacterium sp.]|uniref:YfhO family protein n=1 Tax=Flavobacterium sp. TaxID=239 RepID=UPI003F69DE5D